MSLWDGGEFVAATGGRALGEQPGSVSGISIDTRTLQSGDAFFAIAGDRFDGHDFASQAMRAGAAAIVISEERGIAFGHLQVAKIVVPDVLKALENAGRAARARTQAGIAAVTGSVGKTTTKEMLRTALGASGSTHAAVASFNNHWGVPLTLSRMPRDAAFGIFEIGMNHPGEITPLVGMVSPHVAAITRIAPAHLGHFDSVQEIAKAKAEIFTGLGEGGVAVLNRDDDYYEFLYCEAVAQGVGLFVTFGSRAEADVRLSLSAGEQRAGVSVAGTNYEMNLPLRGTHNAMNAACAIAVATSLGVGPEAAIKALEAMPPVSGRGTIERLRVAGGEITLIDESYNANPVSMAAALDVLAGLPNDGAGRRIAVLGDMRELGKFSHDMHADLDRPVLNARPDVVVLVGEEIGPLADRLDGKVEVYHRANVDAAAPLLGSLLRPNDIVMLKASNGTGLGRLAQMLRDQTEA